MTVARGSADPIPFDRSAPTATGAAEPVSPLVRRLVAPNPGPFTYTGTCSYLVGRGEVAIVDPGPAIDAHIGALLAATAGERVTHCVVTHTHRDHSPAAAAIREVTGCAIVGCARHHSALGEADPLDAAQDTGYAPDRVMRDGERLDGSGFTLVAVATPGHAANHLAFGLPEENTLFSGDHVMAWSTSVVAPPDGSMADYMASLRKLLRRDDALYWPGHGGSVREPQRFVRGLLQHRRQREAAILARVQAGDDAIPAIVARLYEGLAPALAGAAGLSVLAHLRHLAERGLVEADGAPTLSARFRPAPKA